MVRESEVSTLNKPAALASTDPSVQALYEAANRLADARRNAPRFKTRDLVGLLLSHGARTWRNSQPRVRVRLKALSPGGNTAIRLSIG